MGQRFNEIPPALPQDVRHFIAWLSLQHFAPSTIATYVSAVGYYHKIHSWLDPTRDFLVTKLLTGCRRDNLAHNGRWPITIPILTHIINALPYVCPSSYEVALFRAAILWSSIGNSGSGTEPLLPILHDILGTRSGFCLRKIACTRCGFRKRKNSRRPLELV